MKKWEGGKFQFGKAIGVVVVIARGEQERQDGAVRREDAGHVPATRSCCNGSSSEKKHDQLHYQKIVVHHGRPPTLPAVCSQIQVVPRVRVRRRRDVIAVVVCGPKTASIRS